MYKRKFAKRTYGRRTKRRTTRRTTRKGKSPFVRRVNAFMRKAKPEIKYKIDNNEAGAATGNTFAYASGSGAGLAAGYYTTTIPLCLLTASSGQGARIGQKVTILGGTIKGLITQQTQATGVDYVAGGSIDIWILDWKDYQMADYLSAPVYANDFLVNDCQAGGFISPLSFRQADRTKAWRVLAKRTFKVPADFFSNSNQNIPFKFSWKKTMTMEYNSATSPGLQCPAIFILVTATNGNKDSSTGYILRYEHRTYYTDV